MGRKGKRYSKAAEGVEIEKLYDLEQACSLVVDGAKAKFDETVDVAINLGVDPRKSDQNVRGSVSLPHGLGKTIRSLTVCGLSTAINTSQFCALQNPHNVIFCAMPKH